MMMTMMMMARLQILFPHDAAHGLYRGPLISKCYMVLRDSFEVITFMPTINRDYLPADFLSFFPSFFFLSYADVFLPVHCTCRGLLLH
jgi:hypothetical protein